MPRYKVTVGWRHVIVDTAEVEVDADNARQANDIAVKLAEMRGNDETGKAIEWRDGEVVEGKYVVVSGAKKASSAKTV